MAITFEVNGQDDENDTEKSDQRIQYLKRLGYADFWLVQPLPKPCIAVAAETANDNMFQITPSGSAVECVANDNVFRVCFADPDQGTASAKYIERAQTGY